MNTTNNYQTVKQFCESHEAFSVGGVRHQIFNEKNNGLGNSGAIVRMGRKVLIDTDKYFSWVVSGNGTSS